MNQTSGTRHSTVNFDEETPHILVVDDDRRIRELLKKYLSDNGYRVSTAEHAAEARQRLESLAFDLLVLDVMMPGENGLDLTRSLPSPSSCSLHGLKPNTELTGWSAGRMIISPSPLSHASSYCGSVQSCVAQHRKKLMRAWYVWAPAGLIGSAVNCGATTR